MIYILLATIANALFALFVIIGIIILDYRIKREIKKSNKDQQEIKTRLEWMKNRQISLLKGLVIIKNTLKEKGKR